MKHLSVLLVSLVALATSACGGGLGDPTGATCPPTSTLTYTNFGEQFFTDFCTRCHSATASDRNGAPEDFNFDTLQEVMNHAGDIDRASGSGPDATNDFMPEDNDSANPPPTDAQRAQLSEWIACGMPN